jgi:acetyl-CoA carboxylase carboxyl transferase subunit beta
VEVSEGRSRRDPSGPDVLHPLARPSLHERVAERVRSHIVRNGLAVGDRIPSERELASRLAVSRSSVRKAIAGLVSAGVLSRRQGGGTFVARAVVDAGPPTRLAEGRATARPARGRHIGDASGPAAGTSGVGRGELRPLDVPLPPAIDDPLGFPGYPEKLAAVRAEGDAHAVDIGLLTLGEVEVVAARGRFDVLAGSMGRTHGSSIVTAMAYARAHRMPFVALTSSGGARMQEGMLALLQMARTAESVRELREDGVPTLTHLGNPSTGGVFASYASLGDIVLADPDATVGFAGPRVAEAVTGAPVGPDSHRGRSAFANGLVDGLAAPEEAPSRLAVWAELLHPGRRHGPLPRVRSAEHATVDLEAREVVRRARAAGRPSARRLLSEVFDASVELSGDRAGGVDLVAVAAVARLGQRSVVVIGFDRDATNRHGRRGLPSAVAFRTVQRAITLARRHGLPVVALIDTNGADPSPTSEAAGVAGAIAETFVAMLSVDAPTIGAVTGEGGSGGALAIGATDHLMIQDDAFFSVISPEGAATILHRDAGRADEVVGDLRLRAQDLLGLGVVDGVLPGPTTAGAAPATAALRERLVTVLGVLDRDTNRLGRRRARYGS